MTLECTVIPDFSVKQIHIFIFEWCKQIQFEKNTYSNIAELIGFLLRNLTNSTLSHTSYLPSRYIIFRPFLEKSGVFYEQNLSQLQLMSNLCVCVRVLFLLLLLFVYVFFCLWNKHINLTGTVSKLFEDKPEKTQIVNGVLDIQKILGIYTIGYLLTNLNQSCCSCLDK